MYIFILKIQAETKSTDRLKFLLHCLSRRKIENKGFGTDSKSVQLLEVKASEGYLTFSDPLMMK